MRLYIGRNSVPKFRGKFFEDEDLKTTKIREIGPKKEQSCAQGMAIRPYAPRICAKLHYMRLGHALCAPSISNARGACLILFVLWVYPAFLAQTQLEISIINTSIPHSEFLVQNGGRSRGRLLWSFGRIYLLLDFPGYVFIFSNLFLVIMYN